MLCKSSRNVTQQVSVRKHTMLLVAKQSICILIRVVWSRACRIALTNCLGYSSRSTWIAYVALWYFVYVYTSPHDNHLQSNRHSFIPHVIICIFWFTTETQTRQLHARDNFKARSTRIFSPYLSISFFPFTGGEHR